MKMLPRPLAFVVVFCFAASATAADIKVFCTNGVRAVVEELLPQFEKTTGHKVVISFEPSTQIKKRIDAGEPFDVAVMTTTLIDEAIKAGKLSFESRRFIARSGLGLSIRSGSKKPDIASVDSFTHHGRLASVVSANRHYDQEWKRADARLFQFICGPAFRPRGFPHQRREQRSCLQ